ncbi:hypothetical protein [Nannocystis pusilla]|uniref:hypothetical protein n=1 Tax=Nannocystis pusilla TaxID=889268 RepID=UPI003B824970
MARVIGSHERTEPTRLANLTLARWIVGSVVLHGAQERLPAHLTESLVDLFDAVAVLFESHFDAGAAQESGAFRRLHPEAGSLGWLLLHTEITDSQVADHLVRDTGFTPILAEARTQLDRHFTPDTYYTLESVGEPYSDERYLVMAAHVDEPLRAAYARLERFDESWWLERASEWGGRLVFQVASA